MRHFLLALTASVLLGACAGPEPATPTVDASTVVITADDLPESFIVFPVDQVGLTPESLSEPGLEVREVYGFIDQETAEIIIGFSAQTTAEDSDLLLDDPAELAAQVIAGLGGDPTNLTELFVDVGEVSAGFTTDVELQAGLPGTVDVVTLRRGEVLALVTTIYPQGITPVAPIEELAQLLDERAQPTP